MQSPLLPLEIRPARPEDVPSIIKMIREIAAYEKLSHQLEIDEDSLNESLFGNRPIPRAIVAISAGQVIGYAIYFYNYSTFMGRPGIYLEDLYVQDNYRGKGFGDALFKRVAQIAYEENCGRMEWVALKWNKPALDFYQLRGAKQLDEWSVHRFTHEDIKILATG